MSQQFEGELSEQEKQALKDMLREKMPPPFVEERTVERLKQLHLIGASGVLRWANALRIATVATAALAIFALGGFVGLKWVSAPASTTGSPQFILVLRTGTEASQSRSAEAVMNTVRQYSNWASELRRQGLKVNGEKLKPTGQVLRAVDGSAISAAALNSDQNTIAGYFVITARDYDQALEIARSCPHLNYGGFIEVRQIEQF